MSFFLNVIFLSLFILYLANLVQWHTPCRTLRAASANLISVIRCNISFGARGFRSAAPAIWNSLPSNVRSCETHNILPTPKISSFPLSLCHCLVTRLSTSDSFTTMALYKSIYLLPYFLVRYFYVIVVFCNDCVLACRRIYDEANTACQELRCDLICSCNE